MRQLLQDCRALLIAAPAILLIAFFGEFAQHVAEISLGMFASREAFTQLQMAGLRIALGAVKIAALMVTVGLAARWIARRDGSLTGLDKPVEWGWLLVPVVATTGALLAVRFGPIAKGPLRNGLFLAVLLAGFPAMTTAMDALFGQRAKSLKAATRFRPMPPLMEMIAILPVPLLMYLHMRNHAWAYGAPDWKVWALMLWDAALVALLAGIMGVLTYRFYRPPAA